MQPTKKNKERVTEDIDLLQKFSKNSVGIKFFHYNNPAPSFNTSSSTVSLGLKLFTFEESVSFRIHQAIEVLQNNRVGTIVYATVGKKLHGQREGYLFEIDVVGVEDFKKVLHAILPGTSIYSMDDLLSGKSVKPFSFQKVMEEIDRKTLNYKK